MTKKKKEKDDEVKKPTSADAETSASTGEETAASAAGEGAGTENTEGSSTPAEGQEDSAADAEAQHIEEIMLNSKTLVGDVRDALLDRFKQDKEGKPWAQLSEAEQRTIIESITGTAEHLVRTVVQKVATHGFTTARAEIDSWKVKGRQIVISLKSSATEENILALLHGGGNFVNLTFANDQPFDQERSACKPDPDQPDLALDGTNDEDEEFESEGDETYEDRAGEEGGFEGEGVSALDDTGPDALGESNAGRAAA